MVGGEDNQGLLGESQLVQAVKDVGQRTVDVGHLGVVLRAGKRMSVTPPIHCWK